MSQKKLIRPAGLNFSGTATGRMSAGHPSLQNFPRPRISDDLHGQRWAALSMAMFDQMAFESSQRRTPPFTMGQPTKFYDLADGFPSSTKVRKCTQCGFVAVFERSAKEWLEHEDTCQALEQLAVRTIQRLIEQNDQRMIVFLGKYPRETKKAADGLLTRLQVTDVQAQSGFTRETARQDPSLPEDPKAESKS